jgi:hypothetical protein
MGFRATETYSAHIDDVFALLCDPETVTARFEAAGDTDIVIVRCETDGDEFVIETTRTVEVDVPGFAKRVLNPTNAMTQKERWHAPDADGSRRGTMTVDVKGVPATTRATYELRPTDEGTIHTVEGDIELKIPLIGKKLGGFLSGMITETAQADLAFVKARLQKA